MVSNSKIGLEPRSHLIICGCEIVHFHFHSRDSNMMKNLRDLYSILEWYAVFKATIGYDNIKGLSLSFRHSCKSETAKDRDGIFTHKINNL